MTGAPIVWRANGGYQYPPPPSAPGMMFMHAPPTPMLPPVPWFPGPLGVHGIAHIPSTPPPPPPAPAKKVEAKPAPKSAPKKEERKEEPKKEEPKPKTKISRAPPPLKEGVSYMFATEHTIIHIFQKPAPIWMEKYHHAQLAFKIFEVDTQKTVGQMIEYVIGVGPSHGSECKGWAATECIERGDGVFSKGTTIEYDSPKSKNTLASMAWNKDRGVTLPPVWITIHKLS